MELKGAKPGRYHPRCTSCHDKFALIISEDFEQAPEVHALQRKQAEELPSFIETALGLEPPAEAKPRVAQTAADTVAPRSASVGATMAPPSSGERPSAGRHSTRIAPERHPDDVAATLPPETAARQQIGITAPPSDLPTEAAPPRDDQPRLPAETTGTLGGYQLLRKLGEGGMGAVYLAKQLSLNRNVALKVLLEQLAADAQFVARFIREAYAAAQLTHHNVVQIHDIGAQKRTHFFSMEFVEGQNLSSLIREQGRLDPEVAVGYVLQAARGLKFAHDHNMIHRDIKPENLLLNRHGIVKVADLGLVKTSDGEHLTMAAAAKQAAAQDRWYDDDNTTQLNVSMGTPAYMPPEQARDAAHVDARADIYALGCTLYALVVGRPPFTGNTAVEVITKHLKEPVRPPDQLVEHVPAYLSQIILRMMAKPAGRSRPSRIKSPASRTASPGSTTRAGPGSAGG
jgi:eukaryotic-like serine/threonine-protein kinase